jgi:hypothetical protein
MAEMSEDEYQRIRRGVMERRLERLKSLFDGQPRFDSVDEFMRYLEQPMQAEPPPEDRSAKLSRKRR